MTAPPPPANIASRSPELAVLNAGAVLHRFFNNGQEPIYFDFGRGGRLNAPDGSYGVLYTAQEVSGAFAETFLRRPGRQQLPTDLLARKAYARFRTRRKLRFIALTGRGLAKLGATAEITHGGLPYNAPQAWSAALHGHPAAADGIAYTARHDDAALCHAIFDRARDALEEIDRIPDLDVDWFWVLAETYGVGLPPV